MTRLTALLARWETFLLLVLAATLIAGAEISHYFLTSSNFSIALAGAMPISIVALPMTLDHCHRGNRYFGRLDCRVVRHDHCGLDRGGLSIDVAMAAGVAVGALAGLVNGASSCSARCLRWSSPSGRSRSIGASRRLF